MIHNKESTENKEFISRNPKPALSFGTTNSEEFKDQPPTYIGAGALVISKSNRVLLFRRRKDAEIDPYMWTQPGGRIVFGEEPKNTTQRKLLSEVGISTEDLRLLGIHSRVTCSKNNSKIHLISICYLCIKYTWNESLLGEEYLAEWNWFPLLDIPKELTCYTRYSIDRLLERGRDYYDNWQT